MHYLYVCHFSNGHIKVGRSIHPKSRIAAHADRVACVGIELIEFHLAECVGHSTPAEDALIKRCAGAATNRNKNEWFEGLDYFDVCEWADECSQIYIEYQIINKTQNVGKNAHIDSAIKAMGGPSEVARKLDLHKPSTVYQWRVQGRIPAKYCPLIEEETGIPCEALNEDIPWGILRSTPAPAQQESAVA